MAYQCPHSLPCRFIVQRSHFQLKRRKRIVVQNCDNLFKRRIVYNNIWVGTYGTTSLAKGETSKNFGDAEQLQLTTDSLPRFGKEEFGHLFRHKFPRKDCLEKQPVGITCFDWHFEAQTEEKYERDA
jgi:hypothetical protein